jgi:DNA-binding NtrC family response regulator
MPPAAASANATVLVVDDETLIRRTLRARLAAEGCHVLEAATGAAALEQLGDTVDVVLLDHHLPDADGLEWLRKAQDQQPDIPVILLSAHSTVDHAVDAVKRGAFHYVPKDGNLDALALLVRQALDASALRRRLRTTGPGPGADAVIGESAVMQAVKALAGRVAASRASTILLTGETGTGKDLLARTLHALSDRAARPFVTITCSALPDQLLESELFGHERGAFTDARQQKRGLLETADRGTVFLDEIGEMTLPLQAKLLRVLEDKTFKRIGGLQDIRVDVRIVAATHRDLPRRVREGHFREDLFYRLNVLPIRLPALRERRDDIPLLAQYFVDRYNRELAKRVRGLTPEAMARLAACDWPGNVRELRNTIERAMLLAEHEWLTPADFALAAPDAVPFALPPEGVQLEAVERQLLEQALARVGGHQARAGDLLGINRDQVRYRMRKYHVGSNGRGRARFTAAG